jgi:uncharacterized repeat protein (TIGR03803 family)
MKNFSLLLVAMAALLCGANWCSSQTVLTTLYTFNPGSSSAFPASDLTQASDGNYYGTTAEGGTGAFCGISTGCGTVFKISPTGGFLTLYNFCSLPACADGAFPEAGLVQGQDGLLYGTTYDGGISTLCGAYGCGTIFKITTNAILTTLHSFCIQTGCPDGQLPNAALVEGSDGNFYGTTKSGGANNASVCWASNGSIVGCGTAFKVTSDGDLSTLYNFCSAINSQNLCADGYYPAAALVQGTDGDFYGTTSGGGVNQVEVATGGTIFKLGTSGQLTTLYSFCGLSSCADGSIPYAPLTEVGSGTFYGTTSAGGTGNTKSSPPCSGCGTLFEVTSAGQLSTLYNFCSQTRCIDGRAPEGGLILGRNGTVYGTTLYGGAHFDGTVFAINSTSEVTTLHNFCSKTSCADGTWPDAGLAQAADGSFYGTTGGLATVFHLTGSTLTPAKASYSKQIVGTTSSAKTFTLKNKEGVTLNGMSISTTGDFAVLNTSCATSLAVGASCTISVTFTPTQTGIRVGQLSVSDNANDSPQISTLSGTGVRKNGN